jgi:hypothetical protein
MFEPGMVFAFNIDLLETIEITTTGARGMHTYPIEFQQTSH